MNNEQIDELEKALVICFHFGAFYFGPTKYSEVTLLPALVIMTIKKVVSWSNHMAQEVIPWVPTIGLTETNYIAQVQSALILVEIFRKYKTPYNLKETVFSQTEFEKKLGYLYSVDKKMDYMISNLLIQIDQNKADIPVNNNFLPDNMINSNINYPPNIFGNIAIKKEVLPFHRLLAKLSLFPNHLVPIIVGIIHQQMIHKLDRENSIFMTIPNKFSTNLLPIFDNTNRLPEDKNLVFHEFQDT
ncbi:hypothetical protein ACJX0J_032437 [Zea mays]